MCVHVSLCVYVHANMCVTVCVQVCVCVHAIVCVCVCVCVCACMHTCVYVACVRVYVHASLPSVPVHAIVPHSPFSRSQEIRKWSLVRVRLAPGLLLLAIASVRASGANAGDQSTSITLPLYPPLQKVPQVSTHV
jgi:hypothetical protein